MYKKKTKNLEKGTSKYIWEIQKGFIEEVSFELKLGRHRDWKADKNKQRTLKVVREASTQRVYQGPGQIMERLTHHAEESDFLPGIAESPSLRNEGTRSNVGIL